MGVIPYHATFPRRGGSRTAPTPRAIEVGNVLLLGADYPEDVANGNGASRQPEEGAQNGIERQSNSQSEVEDDEGKDE